MRKFKLTKNDVKSLENAANMFDNAILRKGASDILSMSFSGGTNWNKCPFHQACGFEKMVEQSI